MIQRKQTLFLIAVSLLALTLLFVPNHIISLQKTNSNLYLLPPVVSEYTTTSGFMVVVASNFLIMVISFLTMFLFKKRELQVKLCYLLVIVGITQAIMCQFCPFVLLSDTVLLIKNTYVGLFLSLSIALFGFLAQYFIKKDIELLKSADRIR